METIDRLYIWCLCANGDQQFDINFMKISQILRKLFMFLWFFTIFLSVAMETAKYYPLENIWRCMSITHFGKHTHRKLHGKFGAFTHSVTKWSKFAALSYWTIPFAINSAQLRIIATTPTTESFLTWIWVHGDASELSLDNFNITKQIG